MIAVDTSALLAIVNREPERDCFIAALSREGTVSISALTYYEALLVVSSRHGPRGKDEFKNLLATFDLEIVPFDSAMAEAALAAYLRFGKGIHPTASLNLCDCAAYALAKHLALPLLYKGNDFAATDVVSAASQME